MKEIVLLKTKMLPLLQKSMRLERTKNTKRNIVWGYVNKIITLFMPFVVRMIFARELGNEYLGVNSLFTSILQVLSLTELGFTGAVVYCLYEPIAKNNEIEICAILNFLRKIYFVIGTIIFICGLIIIPFLSEIVKSGYPIDLNIYLIYILLLINSSLSYWLFGYRSSLLVAYQRNDILSNIDTVINILLSGLRIIVLLYYKNYYIYTALALVTTVINNIIIYIVSISQYPNIYCKGEISDSTKNLLKEKVGGIMIGKVSGVSRNAFDSIFLSMFIGLTETAIYNNYSLVVTSLTGFMAVIFNSLVSGIGNSVVLNSQQQNYQELNRLNFIYMWMSGWTFICALCLYQPFIRIAFGRDSLFPTSTMIIFCIYYYVLRTGDMFSLYTNANGLWWELRWISALEVVFNIILNFVLGKFFGSFGIVLATTIVVLFIINLGGCIILFKSYFVDYSWKKYCLMQIFYFFVTLVISAITFYITIQFNTTSFAGIAIVAIICLIIPNILYFIVYRKLEIFKDAVGWIRVILRKDA